MRLGVAIPGRINYEAGTVEPLADVAGEIESVGFESAWVFDSLGRGVAHDPLTALTVVASVTSLEVGTGILQVPLRHPVELASRLLSAQVACGDRLVVGVGAGSTRSDYEAVGRDFESRFAVMDESLNVMRSLWTGKTVGAARLHPWPGSEGGPPVLIGAWRSKKWIVRAATEFDGWIASVRNGGWDVMEKGIALFLEHRGRRAVAANIVVDSRAEAAAGRVADYDFEGGLSLGQAADVLARLAAGGFDDAVINCVTGDHEELEAARSLL